MKFFLYIVGSILLASSAYAGCIVEAKCEDEWVLPSRGGEISLSAIAQINAVPNAARLTLTVQKDGKQTRYKQVFYINTMSVDTYLFESLMIRSEIAESKKNHQTSMLNCQTKLREYRDVPRCN